MLFSHISAERKDHHDRESEQNDGHVKRVKANQGVVGRAKQVGLDGQPLVVDKVTPDMPLFREESFGPQVSITRVKSADEAVRVANDTEYGLSAAIFSHDIARAIELAKRVESGICHINGPTVHDEAQMPFGGVKASGYGRELSDLGMHEFLNAKTVVES